MDKEPEACENCYFEDNGYCRRYPPQIKYVPMPQSNHPPVFRNDWCGEYKPKPEEY